MIEFEKINTLFNKLKLLNDMIFYFERKSLNSTSSLSRLYIKNIFLTNEIKKDLMKKGE